MPFTPFHFGAHACVALPFYKKINIFVFLFANVIIDIEPLIVIIFKPTYPLHGYAHTFLGATIIGGIWGAISFKFKEPIEKLLKIFRVQSKYNLKQYVVSGITGALLHVLFDAPLYTDIKPFYTFSLNPFYRIIPYEMVYKICVVLFIPAIIIYILKAIKYKDDIINTFASH
ncbi:MAG: hydrolase [Candidatus Omnitrophica bacterium]|nr:hydrolase [Candidatus Omnitrophota bacterium]